MEDQDPQALSSDDARPVPNPDSPARKRKRNDKTRSDVVYSRKRATTACRPCRARKVKCNNLRPTCDSCAASKATCVYDDPRDHSVFDPASILILDRLNQVLSQLDRISSSPGGHASGHALDNVDAGLLAAPETTLASPISSSVRGPAHDGSQPGLLPSSNELCIPQSRTTPDAVLRWPIFENRFPANYITDAVFLTTALGNEDLDDPRLADSAVKAPSSRGRNAGGIDEDAIPDLVKRFLALVHIKNPILDPETVVSYANYALEEGLKWDPPSCLVLVVCALGCVAQPFPDDPVRFPNEHASLACHSQRLQQGESYFGMARKRFGLLGNDLLGPQCHFLAGVYLMYTMQPLAAWSHFHSASTSYHIYLQCQARQPCNVHDPSKALRRRRREQRLYWSCYKSECELRTEMELPNSCLAGIDYPDMHPSPPEPDASATGGDRRWSRMDSPASQEESWFYYLTEITLRRIGNRIINTFYANPLPDWSDETIPSMTKDAEEFERQLEEWYQGLPSPIRFDEDQLPGQELQYLVQARVLELRTWIYRPFLYYSIHNRPGAPIGPLVQDLVDKAVACCFRGLRIWPILHRHHGTWYALRATASVALCVIAAAKCGTVSLPTGWRETLYACIDRLRFWQDEAPGVPRTIQVLEAYLYDMPTS